MSLNPKEIQRICGVAEEVLTECTGARIRTISRVVTRIFDEHLRPLNIKFTQVNMLIFITEAGSISPHQIATELGYEKSTLTRNLWVLKERGFVDSQRGDSGNRLLFHTTTAGFELVQQAEPAWRQAQAEVTSILGQDITEAIRTAFDRIQAYEKTR